MLEMRRSGWLGGWTAVACLLCVADGRAQRPEAPGRATFEVASVKVNRSGDERMTMGARPGGRFEATNVTPTFLLQFAFDTQEARVQGAPDWAVREHFDIAATGGGNMTLPRTRAMVRALLEERFKLTSHTETRDLRVYSLVEGNLASDRAGRAPNLRPAVGRCDERTPTPRPAPPLALPPPGEPMPCGVRLALGHVSGGGITAAQLADALSRFLDRLVVDRTGLVGAVDVALNFAPEKLQLAVQEQLDLRLVAETSPVPGVVVVDRLERPTPD